MKNQTFNRGALLYNVLASVFIGGVLLAVGAPLLFIGVVLFCLWLIAAIPGTPIVGFRSEVLKQLFASDLQEVLFPKNEFYIGAQTDGPVALDSETVQIPQDENGDSTIFTDPNLFPLPIKQEDNTKKTYALKYLITQPERVGDLQAALVSYDKRAAKLRKHANSLNSKIGDWIANGWTPTLVARKRETTGATSRTAHAPSATGTRKRIAKDDIFWAMSLFNDEDIPMPDRRLLIPAYMYEDLLTIDEFINSVKLRMSGTLGAGQIGEILGFRVYLRSRTTVFNENGTLANKVKKDPGATGATTDNQSALFFHPDFVRYAVGTPKVYIDEDKPEYGGTIMNAALRGGGISSRADEKGTAVLIEDNA